MKLLAPYNCENEEILKETLNEQREVCNNIKLGSFIKRDDRRLKENSGSWTILHYLVTEILKVKGYVFYYQQLNPLAPEDHPDHYYQLTLSNDLWLKNGKKFGNFCIGLDGKYDLNNDHALVLTMVIENNAGYATPLAFAIQTIKQNIPCDHKGCNHEWYYQDLPSENGFERISKYANTQLWNPFVMINKHRPSKIAIQNLLRGSILCWFHIMKTIGKNFTHWNISWSIRYP
ncbi:uncharacterized protein OCT59_014975 [Rhizophagus irregularis]|uniref:uncharacterized protein n=1 Tax=Rhizophagus irregularis TaxID=588596 RepID=UPI003320A13B|nr:hypothetical protein OCT59_014975 [Rhizophagus irregularis]